VAWRDVTTHFVVVGRNDDGGVFVRACVMSSSPVVPGAAIGRRAIGELCATLARHLRGSVANASRVGRAPTSPLVGKADVVGEITRAVENVEVEDLGPALCAFAKKAQQERQERRERQRQETAAWESSSHRVSGASEEKSAVRYLRVHSEMDYSVGAFVLDAGATIPLHNHPHMSVFMKCLFGDCRVTGYDFVSENPELSVSDASIGLARAQEVRLSVNEVLRAGGGATHVLHPNNGGNVHSLVAVTACAIFEVQTPPYAIGGGRDCHYFDVAERDGAGNVTHVREILPPENFHVTRFLDDVDAERA